MENVRIGGQRLQPLYLKRHFRLPGPWPSLEVLSASTASRSVLMNNLRQGRWLQLFSDACSAKSSVAAAAIAAMLLPGAAVAGVTSSRALRPLPTPLHVSRLVETGSHVTSKKHKSGLKSRTGAEAEASEGKHGAASRGGGKRGGKGRGRRTEPVDDPVPMYRAEHGRHNGQGSLDTTQEAMGTPERRHGRFTDEPAPMVTSLRHRHGTTAPKPYGRPLSEYAESHPAASVHASRSGAARGTAAAVTNVHPTMARDAATGGYFVAQPRAYAQGISQPDDDDRISRAHAATAGEAGAAPESAVVASVSAAPAHPTPVVTPIHPPTVVQGFGGEVAVPSSGATSSTDRPGGTRRRSHPSEWVPGPAALNSEPLEEREAITEAAVSPAVLPMTYDRNGHLLMPAPLKGSHDVLVHQNVMADSDGLERIQTDADLERLRAAHLLVALPASESLHVNEDLPANRRTARPWTALFAGDIGHAFYQRFHEPIYLTSAVRTVNYQAHLQMVNGNAAGLWGESASPHLTGQAVDLAKRGMSSTELAWMRAYLLPLMQAGKIDVEEEFHQACFHVSVYRSYAAGRHTIQHEVAQVHATPAQVEDTQAPVEPEDR